MEEEYGQKVLVRLGTYLGVFSMRENEERRTNEQKNIDVVIQGM